MRKYLAVAIAAAVTTCGLAVAGPAAADTVWLCKPGKRNDPCSPSLSTTRISPSGKILGTERPARVRRPKVDCFYVYPTVSDDRALQADRSIDPELRSIAQYQAARYSSDCKVYAPVYRQITLQGLLNPSAITPEMRATAYADVRAAWSEYMRKHNKGRGVVIVGHSQGTFVLRQLIASEIDRKPSVRKRMIGAYLLGGNVLVKKGEDRGGDFRNIRACRSTTQLGCVVAFSIYNAAVPDNPRFGKTTEAGREVLCTNPASLEGGAGKLDSIVPSDPFADGTTIGALVNQTGFATPRVRTEWLSTPDSYRARCVRENGAHVLQTAPLPGAPTLRTFPDATWGVHLGDANLPLGNLVELAKRQIAAYDRRN